MFQSMIHSLNNENEDTVLLKPNSVSSISIYQASFIFLNSILSISPATMTRYYDGGALIPLLANVVCVILYSFSIYMILFVMKKTKELCPEKMWAKTGNPFSWAISVCIILACISVLNDNIKYLRTFFNGFLGSFIGTTSDIATDPYIFPLCSCFILLLPTLISTKDSILAIYSDVKYILVLCTFVISIYWSIYNSKSKPSYFYGLTFYKSFSQFTNCLRDHTFAYFCFAYINIAYSNMKGVTYERMRNSTISSLIVFGVYNFLSGLFQYIALPNVVSNFFLETDSSNPTTKIGLILWALSFICTLPIPTAAACKSMVMLSGSEGKIPILMWAAFSIVLYIVSIFLSTINDQVYNIVQKVLYMFLSPLHTSVPAIMLIRLRNHISKGHWVLIVIYLLLNCVWIGDLLYRLAVGK